MVNKEHKLVPMETVEYILRIACENGMLPPFTEGIKNPSKYVQVVIDGNTYSGQCRWDEHGSFTKEKVE